MMSQASGPTPSLALSTERAERVGRYVSASKSTNTQRMYRAQWSQFESYCLKHGYQALPAQPAAVADYITPGRLGAQSVNDSAGAGRHWLCA